MGDGRHCKHGLHVAEGCAICFGSDNKTWRGTYIDLAYILARDNEPDWMRAAPVAILPAADHNALTQALADAKAERDKTDEAIQQCRTYLRGCMNHAFNETPIVEVAKDVSEEFHRNRYQIQCMAKERDTIAKDRDCANLLLKRLMCVVVPDNVVPNDMKEFVRDSAATVLKDLYEYLKTDVDLRKAEHDAK